jgi:tetratricopeptide (TPR) repeat protein
VEESRLSNLRVPATLDRLLQVRYDTLLFPEKLLLQRASVLGRLFHDSAIEALDEADEVHLADIPGILDELVERGFIQMRETSSFEGHTEYIYTQQMMRDSIYDKLLRRQLITYHSAAAEWLVGVAGDRVDEYYPLLANHYALGEQSQKAAEYLRLSGERSFAVSAFADAQAAYETALALIPSTHSHERMLVKTRLGELLNSIGDLSQAGQVLGEALQAARDLGDKNAQANALYQLGINATHQGRWEAALTHLDKALELARAGEDRGTLARVLYGLGDAHFRIGNHSEASNACQEAIEIAEEIGDQATLMNAINRLGAVETSSHNHNQAKQLFQQCLALARETGNLERQSAALTNLGNVANVQEDWHEAIRYCQDALILFRELGHPFGVVVAAGNLANAHIRIGDLDKARSLVVEVISAARQAGSKSWLISSLTVLANQAIVENDYQRGLELLGLISNHPATMSDVKDEVNQLLMPRLRTVFSEEEVQAGMEVGMNLDLDTVIDNYLAEEPNDD